MRTHDHRPPIPSRDPRRLLRASSRALLIAALAACGPAVTTPEEEAPDAGPCLPLCSLDALPDGGQIIHCGGPDRRDGNTLPWCSRCDVIRPDGGDVVVYVRCY